MRSQAFRWIAIHLLSLVPKLCLGMSLSRKLCVLVAAKQSFEDHVRSQTEFGNEGKGRHDNAKSTYRFFNSFAHVSFSVIVRLKTN